MFIYLFCTEPRYRTDRSQHRYRDRYRHLQPAPAPAAGAGAGAGAGVRGRPGGRRCRGAGTGTTDDRYRCRDWYRCRCVPVPVLGINRGVQMCMSRSCLRAPDSIRAHACMYVRAQQHISHVSVNAGKAKVPVPSGALSLQALGRDVWAHSLTGRQDCCLAGNHRHRPHARPLAAARWAAGCSLLAIARARRCRAHQRGRGRDSTASPTTRYPQSPRGSDRPASSAMRCARRGTRTRPVSLPVLPSSAIARGRRRSQPPEQLRTDW